MDDEVLINSVFIRLPLWDKENRDHHNRYVLEKLWAEVANTMQCDGKYLCTIPQYNLM